jgi:AcrR family transcriptional regulator
MARPVAADAEATRRRILDTARHLFSSQGNAETSMRQIAKGAGVSLATVHHYFGSKAELFQSAIDAMYVELATLRDELAPVILGGADDLEGALRETIRRTYAFVCKHRDEVRLLMRTVIGTGKSDSERREAFLLPLLDQGAAILHQLTGAPLETCRMTLLSLNHLVIRYALTDEEELVEVVGVPRRGKLATQVDAANGRVETHLVDVARSQLGIGASS